jgi:hypothetical protein
MPVPFVFRVRGVVRGVPFVSDASMLVRADLVAGVPAPAGVTDVPSESLEPLLQVPHAARATALAELTPSRATAGVFCTPGGVELAEKYVWLLSALGRDITLYATTPTEPVVVVEGVRVLATMMPVVPARETASVAIAPSTGSIRVTEAFAAAQHLRLLGAYDGGTWARLVARVVGGVPETITATQLRDVLLDARKAAVDAGNTGGPAAEAEGLFVLDAARARPDEVVSAVRALAASFGARDVAVGAPLDIRAVHASLGRALAGVGSPCRAYLVGDEAPFVLIRERLEPIGPFAPVRVFEPDHVVAPASLDVSAFLKSFAGAIAGPQARVEHLASMDAAETRVSPAHQVHVLRRSALSGGAESFFLVTTGLCWTRLASAAPGALDRVELTTWTSRYDGTLATTMSQIGITLHALAREGSRFALGDAVSTDERGFMGWPRVLLSRFVAPIAMPLGRIDVARVTPITNEEWATKQRLGLDVLGGEPFVRGLESKGVPALLGRWYAPPPRAMG